MQWMHKIRALIEEKFVCTEHGYIPKDQGRQEYRQCGTKEESLVLRLEEALFEIDLPSDALDEYARTNGYSYFLVYKKIRDMGWILLPCPPHCHTYYLYQPNKHFNRKTAETELLLQIVSPESIADHLVFERLGHRRIVFAVAENGSFVLLEGAAVSSPEDLLSRYTPVSRR
jgi:hypothetical protein